MPKQQGNPTQGTIVKETLGARAEKRMTSTTERITLPGIETLHLRPADEVAEALTNVLKSRAHITSIRYQVGAYIEITSDSDLSLMPS